MNPSLTATCFVLQDEKQRRILTVFWIDSTGCAVSTVCLKATAPLRMTSTGPLSTGRACASDAACNNT